MSADTCPGDKFLDDVKNYMDYSDDACMDHFTPGQNALMNKMWNRYRAGENPSPTITTTVLPATSTPTSGTELGTIIFDATKLKPTVTGRLIQGVEVRMSYDVGRMGFGCPTLRYCYRFGWFSPKVCETVPANEAGSIPITFDNYGTAYLSFENVDGENVCALDWPGFRGYSVTVDSQ